MSTGLAGWSVACSSKWKPPPFFLIARRCPQPSPDTGSPRLSAAASSDANSATAVEGCRTSYKLQATSYKLQDTRYKLQATSDKLQATSYKLQAASYKLQAASCKLQATSYKLQAASCKLQATSYKLGMGLRPHLPALRCRRRGTDVCCRRVLFLHT